MYRRAKSLLICSLLAVTAGVLIPSAAHASIVCKSWTNSNSKGHADGTACWDPANTETTVHGRVRDDAADGYCVYIRVHWTNGTTSDSDWACPRGTLVEFDIVQPYRWSNNSIESFHA
jgi:hypothetical protein